ncbi:hypothetical protein [Ensifer canadensis]
MSDSIGRGGCHDAAMLAYQQMFSASCRLSVGLHHDDTADKYDDQSGHLHECGIHHGQISPLIAYCKFPQIVFDLRLKHAAIQSATATFARLIGRAAL